jgi:hypothetical protein
MGSPDERKNEPHIDAVDDSFDPCDAYAAIDRVFADGWNDPLMDDYDRYEELKELPLRDPVG